MTTRDKKSGYVIGWVLGITCIASILLMVCMEAISGYCIHQESSEKIKIVEQVRKISRVVLTEDYSYAFTNFCRFDLNRLTRRLQWAFPEGVQLLNVKKLPYSSEPFGEDATLENGTINTHPQGSLLGRDIKQEIHIEYYCKSLNIKKSIQLIANLREIPSNEMAFIHLSVFSPKNLDFDITVNGDAMFNGFIQKPSNHKLTCENLITKFYLDKSGTMDIRNHNYLYSSYHYAFSYGIDPFRLLLPDGDSDVYKRQSYLENSYTLNILFDGESLSHDIPGISVRPFNESVNRVIIDLNKINRPKGIIYIHASNETAANQGIVVIGAAQFKKNQPHAILTNSNIWLWRDHQGLPMILGTTTGKWTLTDSSWHEGSTSISPLKIKWNGYIFSPYDFTTFSSPQSGYNKGVFEIKGTLLAGGSISGNLKELQISGPLSYPSTAKICEKFLILENIE